MDLGNPTFERLIVGQASRLPSNDLRASRDFRISFRSPIAKCPLYYSEFIKLYLTFSIT